MKLLSHERGMALPENDRDAVEFVHGGLLTHRDVAAMPMRADDLVVIGAAVNTYRLDWQDENGGSAALQMEPGRIVVTPPGVVHRARWQPHAAFAVAFLDVQEAVQWVEPTLNADEVEIASLAGRVDRDLSELVVNLARATKQSIFDNILGELSTHVLRRYADVRAHPLRWSRAERATVVDFIESHLADDCSVDRIARTVGYSRTHFARRFKRTFGMPVHRFVLCRRFHRARVLLALTDWTVNAIAAEVGFANAAHLATTFRIASGRSPASYRARDLEPRL